MSDRCCKCHKPFTDKNPIIGSNTEKFRPGTCWCTSCEKALSYRKLRFWETKQLFINLKEKFDRILRLMTGVMQYVNK